MQMRTLGRTKLEVSAFCLGGNTFGWTTDEAASYAVLDAFMEAGGNFVDTADVYSRWVPGNSGGESEAVLGRWMKSRGNRADVVIATKLGSPMGPGDADRGLSREYMQRAVEASLGRLQTDYIDLYQAHQDDQGTPLDETLSAFGELIQRGIVRHIGASNYSAARLAEAEQVAEQLGVPRYESIQPPYNLVNRTEYERELEPLCRERQVSVITYSSLASGFLAGKYRPDADLPTTARASGVQQRYMNERGFAVLAAVDEVAQRVGATPAQVALAWIVQRPGVTAPIASATSVPQLQELAGAFELPLDDDAVTLLDRASAA